MKMCNCSILIVFLNFFFLIKRQLKTLTGFPTHPNTLSFLIGQFRAAAAVIDCDPTTILVMMVNNLNGLAILRFHCRPNLNVLILLIYLLTLVMIAVDFHVILMIPIMINWNENKRNIFLSAINIAMKIDYIDLAVRDEIDVGNLYTLHFTDGIQCVNDMYV